MKRPGRWPQTRWLGQGSVDLGYLGVHMSGACKRGILDNVSSSTAVTEMNDSGSILLLSPGSKREIQAIQSLRYAIMLSKDP